MATSLRLVVLAWLLLAVAHAAPSPEQIPAPLREWTGWVLWDEAELLNAPRDYNNADRRHAVWPSALDLAIEGAAGRFSLSVTVYAATRMELPGSADAWPVRVEVDGEEVAVTPKEGRPALDLKPGAHTITGEFNWSAAPSQLRVPGSIGLLRLTLDGEEIRLPSRDAGGTLWLRQQSTQEAEERDFLETRVYAVLSDGIPMRWESLIELTVSGRNREEAVGVVLPEGWRLASLKSPIPAMLDAQGNLKAQVRSGRWEIRLSAFRLDAPSAIRFPEETKPAVEDLLIAFRAAPSLRTIDLVGPQQVDASLTTFPAEWRKLPLYGWKTTSPITLEERMRGSGEEKNGDLVIHRTLWLNEERPGLIFHDRLGSAGQTLWRLNASPGQQLEAVKINGKGQLITRDPGTGTPGVEIRDRAFELEANGQTDRRHAFPATGWEAGAKSLGILLHLPPGWRLFACFGADQVEGDWLTSWTLLDLFLLLVFTIAVYRLWGVKAGFLAFFAFGLAYHEPSAPVYTWLFLLIPLALLKVVKGGKGRTAVQIFKGVALALLLVHLVPFIFMQIQQAIYPQLEERRILSTSGYRGLKVSSLSAPAKVDAEVTAKRAKSLYTQEANAKVQAGRGVPNWEWRTARLEWSGPVAAGHEVRPILLPRGVVQGITLLRVALLICLAAVLLGGRKIARLPGSFFKGKAAALWIAALFSLPLPSASAEVAFPTEKLLIQLRSRLLEVPDAFPEAADIPQARLEINGRSLIMEAQVHAAAPCAVPLPGRFPAWAPLRVRVDEQEAAVLRREDGYLWIALSEGVHTVRVEGVVTHHDEWEWSYLLAPRRVEVAAPEWNVTGWSSEAGRPGAQLFFTRKERAGAVASGYDRQEVESWVSVERTLELGLNWSVTTKVIRHTPTGRALNLRIPLLKGERVVSQNAMADEGAMEVRLGAQEKEMHWTSELEQTERLLLSAGKEGPWVERWRVGVSPIWNLAISGLAPIFEQGTHLVPTWQPWPGEEVSLVISRPEPIEGATVAVESVKQEVKLGARQRTTMLTLELQSSMGEEFALSLPADAEITSLQLKERPHPVRRDNGKVLIALTPGEQTVKIEWRREEPLRFASLTDEISLPLESRNISIDVTVPKNRWILATNGPLRGPAVRFWGIALGAVLCGWLLSRVPLSPLKAWQWSLLFIGISQGWIFLSLVVVGWFFLFVWRGHDSFRQLPAALHNFVQVSLIALTAVFIGILLFNVWRGLLGTPEMFIEGDGSYRYHLAWFEPQATEALPRPGVLSVSIWWYRLLMLLWALWLANALVRWLGWAWKQFSSGEILRSTSKPVVVEPPPLPGERK